MGGGGRVKKKEKSWNVLDVGMILLALFCLVSAGGRIWEIQKDKSSLAAQESYMVVLCAREVPVETAACLASGETLYLENGTPLGALTEMTATVFDVWIPWNGAYYAGSSEELSLCEVTLRVEVKGFLQDGIAVCGGQRLIPGGEIGARSLRGDWRLQVLAIMPL